MQYPINMTRSIFQGFDFTCSAMKSLHSNVSNLHSAAQRGTITRAIDVCPVGCAFVVLCMILAIVMIASLVWVARADRKLARELNAYIPSAPTMQNEVQTFNMKGNR